MLKSLEQINREFMEAKTSVLDRPLQSKQERKTRRRKAARLATNILLYAAIVFTIVAVIILNVNSNRGFNLFGYYGFTVISGSMQSEIPEGSLVLVKDVGPDNISIGDDITYIRKKDGAFVIHQVMAIYENYGESGGKGFQTQGTENTDPDQVIYADDIIGTVKLIIPGLGAVLTYTAVNVGLLSVIFGGITVIVIATKKLLLPRKVARE